MKKTLDNNIMQTKTVHSIVELLKRTKLITKTSTVMAKDINREIDFVINFYNKSKRKVRRDRKVDLTYTGKTTGVYKVHM
tara:strand:- start:1292 stop:1531 length:240 start_codon:yes stop_codon:yes gene_type:complete